MSIGVKKAVLGVVVALLVGVLAIPTLFWVAVRAIDNGMGFAPIMPAPPALILAAASGLLGLFWVTWSWSYLIFVGKGLPVEAFGKALHPTSVLVTAGPYAYTRNPMVLGYLIVLLGVAFLARSISGVVAIPILAAIAYIYLVTFEEKALIRRFGPDYEKYRRSVPALFPRLSAYVHGATT